MAEEEKRAVQIALIGAGTVGSGVLRILAENAEIIARRALPLQLRWLSVRNKDRGQRILDELGFGETRLTTDWQEALADPATDIVVELIGGITPAREIISAALAVGKSVVTANKDLMALHGGELLQLAAVHQANLFFEASVCGGIPIIQALKENLAGNRFLEILGIVNGTTNYILTRMQESEADFAEALADAQALGYAEADPTADVEGDDAARKMAILSSIAFNSRVTYDMVSSEGIAGISRWDIRYAADFGYTIKMLGIARCDGEAVEVRVHPVMLRNSHPLATVRDAYNAVFVQGDALDKAMFYGRGAGGAPTGSAVVGDIIAAARDLARGCGSRWGCTCYRQLPVRHIDDTVSKYYIRVQVQDRVGVFASLAQALSAASVSMDSVMQKRKLPDGGSEIVIITHPSRHSNIRVALDLIARMECVREISEYIRVEDDAD